MTLIAAFRAREGGILLCADREENDGFSKREVEKISRLSLLQCQMFIAGAGYAPIIKKAQRACEEAISNAAKEGADLRTEHHDLLERALEATYTRYVKSQDDEIALLIAMVPESEPRIPILYRSHSAMLVQESLYAAGGSGKFISDFLADRLYQHGIGKAQLLLLASFIFREAGQAVSGVGFEAEMVLIYNGDRSLQFYGTQSVKELQTGIPKISDSIYAHWKDNAKLPEWWGD
jgi:20S proteasome alpha/beta subunit